VTDNLNVSLQDDELLSEIRLATTLMIFASRSDHRLSVAEVDEVLDVHVVGPFRQARPAAPAV
jgi:hypothetical protein